MNGTIGGLNSLDRAFISYKYLIIIDHLIAGFLLALLLQAL